MTPEGFMDKTARTIIASGFLLLAGVRPGRASDADRPSRPETELKNAESEADGLVDKEAERRIEARNELERIKKDLRYISEELDRETLDEESAKPLSEYSLGGETRLKALRAHGSIDPRLTPVLDQLESLYRRLPEAAYAQDYAGSLVKAINEELRWVAESSSGVDEMLRTLGDDLSLPASIAGDGDVDDLAFFPEDLPLAKFKKLGPIKIFLMKHRLKRPKSYAVTTPRDLIAGKHHVQVGVDIMATVTGAHLFPVDRDYTFDFGDLHLEITPEWRLLHKGMPLPKVGQKVRIKGWSYFDSFHGSELEYDPQDPVVGAERVTVWEVHPVQDVEILK